MNISSLLSLYFFFLLSETFLLSGFADMLCLITAVLPLLPVIKLEVIDL